MPNSCSSPQSWLGLVTCNGTWGPMQQPVTGKTWTMLFMLSMFWVIAAKCCTHNCLPNCCSPSPYRRSLNSLILYGTDRKWADFDVFKVHSTSAKMIGLWMASGRLQVLLGSSQLKHSSKSLQGTIMSNKHGKFNQLVGVKTQNRSCSLQSCQKLKCKAAFAFN